MLCADYQRQVSYGGSIVAANLLYTAATVWDKNATQLGAADWAAVAANTGYAWGYAGLWLVDGQLGSPDPGCGLQVTHSSSSWALQLTLICRSCTPPWTRARCPRCTPPTLSW